MAKNTEEIKESLKRTRTVFLATYSQKGMPNIVPTGLFRFMDNETFLIYDRFSKKNLQNLSQNPVWREKGGYQIRR